MPPVFELVLLTLATWRITHLVIDDAVPFAPARAWLIARFPAYGWGIECLFCTSVWSGWAASAVGYWALHFSATASLLLAAGGMSALVIFTGGVIDWVTSAPDHD